MAEEPHTGTDSLNPYSETPAQQGASNQIVVRPAGVTVVGVLACVLGGIGLLMGAWMLINTLAGPRIAQAFTVPGPYQQAQTEMYARTQQLSLRYQPANIASSVGSMIVGIGLFVGGVGAIRGRRWARTWLVRAFVLAMILECLKIIPVMMLQLEMLPIMEQYMERIATNPTAKNPAQPLMAGTFAKAMMLVGLAVWIGWLVIKLVCFGFAARYLGRPAVREFFASHI